MKTILSVLVTVIAVECAPVFLPEGRMERPVPRPRVKRSSPGYVFQTPCAAAQAEAAAAAAASSSVPVVAPPTGYHFVPEDRHAYNYGYEMPYYRGQEPEVLHFSDMSPVMSENIPMHHPAEARSYHQYQPYLPATPALAVFPGADGKKGCSVPLLFSCTPSIVPGQVGHAHPYYGREIPTNQDYRYTVDDPMVFQRIAPELTEENLSQYLRETAMHQQHHQQQAMSQHHHQEARHQHHHQQAMNQLNKQGLQENTRRMQELSPDVQEVPVEQADTKLAQVSQNVAPHK